MAQGPATVAHSWLTDLENWARKARENLEVVLPELVQAAPAAEQVAATTATVAAEVGIVSPSEVQAAEHVAETVGRDALTAAEVAARIL